jgi:hypothetical protein
VKSCSGDPIALKDNPAIKGSALASDTVLRYATWISIIAGTTILVGGAILLAFPPLERALGVVGAGLGFVAAGYAGRAELILQEIRRGEIDEKIAVLYAYQQKKIERVVSDLRALEKISSSATKQQVHEIRSEGTSIVQVLLAANLSEVGVIREILNKILERHKEPPI